MTPLSSQISRSHRFTLPLKEQRKQMRLLFNKLISNYNTHDNNYIAYFFHSHASTVAVTLDTGVPTVGVLPGHLCSEVEESINTQAHY